jgi:hypothetical protein
VDVGNLDHLIAFSTGGSVLRYNWFVFHDVIDELLKRLFNVNIFAKANFSAQMVGVEKIHDKRVDDNVHVFVQNFLAYLLLNSNFTNSFDKVSKSFDV